MSTLADLRSDLEGIVDTAMTATGITHAMLTGDGLGTDHLVPVGEARWVVICSPVTDRALADGNTNYQGAEVVVRMVYKAAGAAARGTWIETHIGSLAAALLPSSAWLALAAVHEVTGGPEGGSLERVGNAITWEIAAVVAIAP